MMVRLPEESVIVALKDIPDGDCFVFPDEKYTFYIKLKPPVGLSPSRIEAVKLNGDDAGRMIEAPGDYAATPVDCELVVKR